MNSSTDLNGEDDDVDESNEKEEGNESILTF